MVPLLIVGSALVFLPTAFCALLLSDWTRLASACEGNCIGVGGLFLVAPILVAIGWTILRKPNRVPRQLLLVMRGVAVVQGLITLLVWFPFSLVALFSMPLWPRWWALPESSG